MTLFTAGTASALSACAERRRPVSSVVIAIAMACVTPSLAAQVSLGVPHVDQRPAPRPDHLPKVIDIGRQSGFQDTFLGHHKRARASLAVDFDLDGWVDFYVGNPGDESFVMRNTGLGLDGIVHFELVQVLLDGPIAWGAAAADYDNDGDYDIMVTIGGNELIPGPCLLFKNLVIETGILQFEDVTDVAGVRGIVPPGWTDAMPANHSNCVWADYDQDADVDVFVSVNIGSNSLPTLKGRNILFENNGDGTFTDVTDAVGLGVTFRSTQHSTFFDFDNDGDMDLYENNFGISVFPPNVLWQNQLAETGQAVFLNRTSQYSLPGEDMGRPRSSFVSAAADFNNDGWQDLFVLHRLCSPCEDLYDTGHVLFMNFAGAGFANVADVAGINNPYWGDGSFFDPDQGVMGS
ncbi:MAG: hypothetical protein DRQ55_17165, partial [Planctomycetota bacterium]